MTIDMDTANTIADAGLLAAGDTRRNDAARLLSARDTLPLEPLIAQWRSSENVQRMLSDRGSLYSADYIARNPSGRSHSIPDFFLWMRGGRRGPWASAVQPAQPAQPAGPSLPTSPQDAFPTWDLATAAMDRWLNDTDPRLPQFYSTDESYPRGGQIGYLRSCFSEMEPTWRRDEWPSDEYHATPYARGFWRDVRELGYGTEYWTAVSKPRETVNLTAGQAAMPIGPDHPDWNSWWERLNEARGGRYATEFQRLAAAMGYVAPVTYTVTLNRVSAPAGLNRSSLAQYLREHPEAIPERAYEVYTD